MFNNNKDFKLAGQSKVRRDYDYLVQLLIIIPFPSCASKLKQPKNRVGHDFLAV